MPELTAGIAFYTVFSENEAFMDSLAKR